jgi:hypothetical protein
MTGLLRPESWIRPAGGSPAWVGTGAPSSRPRSGGESRPAERGVKSLFGGSKSAARSGSESCSLVRFTTGEPSRSTHGEGHVRRVLVRKATRRVSSGYGDRDVLKVWFGTGETRLRRRRQRRAARISRR